MNDLNRLCQRLPTPSDIITKPREINLNLPATKNKELLNPDTVCNKVVYVDSNRIYVRNYQPIKPAIIEDMKCGVCNEVIVGRRGGPEVTAHMKRHEAAARLTEHNYYLPGQVILVKQENT